MPVLIFSGMLSSAPRNGCGANHLSRPPSRTQKRLRHQNPAFLPHVALDLNNLDTELYRRASRLFEHRLRRSQWPFGIARAA